MIRLAALLALAGTAACSAEPGDRRQAHSPAEVAEAERHAVQLIGFAPDLARADFSKFAVHSAAPGRIDGKAVQCAQLRPGAVAGRKPGWDRVLVIGEAQIADARVHSRSFQVLWDAAGC